MKHLKVFTILSLILFSKGAFSQVAFVDTFFDYSNHPGNFLQAGYISNELNDSGYAVMAVGISENLDPVIRTDKNGKILWVDPIFQSSEYGNLLSFYRSNDGNIVIAFTQNQVYDSISLYHIIKLNSKTGSTIWNISLSQVADSIYIQGLAPAADGGFFISGIYQVNSQNPVAGVIKIDSTGKLLWFKKYNNLNAFRLAGIQSNNEDGAWLVFTYNQGYYFYSYPESIYQLSDSLDILDINSVGNVNWQYSLKATIVDDTLAYFVYGLVENSLDSSLTLLTNFTLSGDTMLYDNLAFFKFNSSGNIAKTFTLSDAGTGINSAYCSSISNNNYNIVGQIGRISTVYSGYSNGYFPDSALFYLQTDSNGNILWEKKYTPPLLQPNRIYSNQVNSDYTFLQSIIPIEDTELAVSGEIVIIVDDQGHDVPYGVADYLMRYGTGIPIINPQSTTLSIYPNPTTDNLLIVAGKDQSNAIVKIYNEQGEQMLNAPLSLPQGSPQSIDVSNLSAGLYLITLQTGDELVTRKFIKM